MLWGGEGTVISWFRGSYSACGIEVKASDTISCSLPAKEFSQLTSLFEDDEDVTLSTARNALVMASRRRKLELRQEDEASIESYRELVEKFQPTVEVDQAAFIQELRAASEIVAKSISNPILTGIRLLAQGKGIAIMSANGSSMVFQSGILATVKEGETLEEILPTQDTMDVLKSFGSGDNLQIGKYRRSIVFKTSDAIFRIPLLSGKWPPMTHLRSLTFDRGTLPISTEVIKSVAAAQRIYHGEKGSKNITVRPADDYVTVETAPSEKGQFVEELDATLFDSHTLNIDDMEAVAKVCKDDLQIAFGETMSLATGAGNRRVYVLQRV